MTEVLLPLALILTTLSGAALLGMRVRDRWTHSQRLSARLRESAHLAAAARATLAEHRRAA